MPFSYNKLWKLLIDKNMRKIDLRDAVGFTPATLAKLGKNQSVSMDILERICAQLDCDVGDIVEYVKEPIPKPHGVQDVQATTAQSKQVEL